MSDGERNLSSHIRITSKTPDNVKTVDLFIRRVKALILFGFCLLLVSLALHIAREGFSWVTVLDWLRDVFGSVGIELAGAGVVAYLIFKVNTERL